MESLIVTLPPDASTLYLDTEKTARGHATYDKLGTSHDRRPHQCSQPYEYDAEAGYTSFADVINTIADVTRRISLISRAKWHALYGFQTSSSHLLFIRVLVLISFVPYFWLRWCATRPQFS